MCITSLINGHSTQCRSCADNNREMRNLKYERTHAEVGAILGITRQAVQQIEAKAFRKIKIRILEMDRQERELVRV